MQMTATAHDQATAIVHPAEAALDLLALAVACSDSDRASALWLFAFAALKGWNSWLDAASAQLTSKVRAIVSLAHHQLFRLRLGTPAQRPSVVVAWTTSFALFLGNERFDHRPWLIA